MRLQTAMDEGHCGLPVNHLTGLAERLLEVEVGPKREEIAGRQHLASWPERHSGSPPMILCAHDTWVAVGWIAHRMIATEPL